MSRLTGLFFGILFIGSHVLAATPDTVNQAQQQNISKFPWAMLMGIDPSDPTKLIPILIDATGAIVTGVGGLPTGASTEEKQDDLNALIVIIDAVLDAIKADTANLTSDPATATLQTTLNSLIATMDAVLDLILVDTTAIKDNTDSATTPGFGTVSVTTTATQILAADSNRRSALIRNADSNTVLFLGFTSGVTTANGLPLGSAGASGANGNGGTVIYTHTGDIWGIVSSGTADSRWQTESD